MASRLTRQHRPFAGCSVRRVRIRSGWRAGRRGEEALTAMSTHTVTGMTCDHCITSVR
ncbi:hypothetical protein TOK_5455 [Pseudonocardia sp. N23]|nr:hypothetical protein TOK_5455 [Pseudonocardia sp. N23]